MIINMTPIRLERPQPVVTVAGDVITIDGDAIDLTQLPEDGVLPHGAVDSPWVIENDITRTDGEISLTMLLPIGPNASEASRFPAPIIVDADGPVVLPPYSAEDAA